MKSIGGGLSSSSSSSAGASSSTTNTSSSLPNNTSQSVIPAGGSNNGNTSHTNCNNTTAALSNHNQANHSDPGVSNQVVDEMFPERMEQSYSNPFQQPHWSYDVDESGYGPQHMMDAANHEKFVHADFYNDFDDLFDEENLD
jgi:hypothetical protein